MRLTISEAIGLVETGVRLERLGRGEPFDLALRTDQPDTCVAGADTPIIEILRRHPSRVGPIVTLLSRLQDLLPELVDGEIASDENDIDEPDLYLVS